MRQKNNCANCKHWKNKQAELDYSDDSGICLSPLLKYDVSADSAPPNVLDRGNLSGKFRNTQWFETKSGPPFKVEKSRYALVTGWDFGCVFFEKSPPEK